MKIVVFDIDGPIIDEMGFLKKNAPIWVKKKYNIDIQEVNPYGYTIYEIYNLKEKLLENGMNMQEAIEKGNKISKAFWPSNFVKYCMQPVRDGVKEIIEQYHSEGYQIRLVSTRGVQTTEKCSFKSEIIRKRIVPFLTKMQLRRGKVQYDNLNLVSSIQDKLEYINAYRPEYVFEDRAEILSEIPLPTIPFCINCCHNLNTEFPNNIIRFDRYDDDQLSNIIKKNDDKKDLKEHVENDKSEDGKISPMIHSWKNMTETTYSLVKNIVKPYFMCKVRPIISGKENIPNNGSTVFIGNHRDKLDPVMVSLATKRKIHWIALYRMFYGKESLFSSTRSSIRCNVSSFFITSLGTLPITRKKDQDYNIKINFETYRKIFLLHQMGGAAGVFPEATMNRTPNEQNLCPIKSEQMFKLVIQQGIWLQPFTIVWVPKEAGIKNKTIIRFSPSINPENRTRQELLELWKNIENRDINQANELIDSITAINNSDMNVFDKKEHVKTLIRQFKNK